MDIDERYDVVVIGGGAAGLSGAVALARSRRAVLVVDDGTPRNAPAEGVHNFLSRDGTPPTELLAAGRAEAAGYGVRFADGRAVTAERLDRCGFLVELADGRRVRARRLLVTTGVVDELPDVPGLAGLWGHDVLHCPYCHGWEVRDQPIGVLACGPMGVHQALLFSQLSADVTLFTHTAPEPSEADRKRLAARGVAVVDGEVTGLEVTDGRLTGVRMAGGEVVARRALAVQPVSRARSQVLDALGLRPVELRMGEHVLATHIAADPRTGATDVPGVHVAGNLAEPMAQVMGSAAAGLMAGAAMNMALIEDDLAAV
jgi:thioredoxin reductase